MREALSGLAQQRGPHGLTALKARDFGPLSSEIHTSEQQKESMHFPPVLQSGNNYLENMLGCLMMTESLAILSSYTIKRR